MYYFDNNNNNSNNDDPSPSPNENSNNNYNAMYSQSFHPSSFHHQSHSLDDNLSYMNFDNNTAPPSSFLQDCVVGSLGHDSLLAQDWNSMYNSSFPDNSHQHGQLFLPLQDQQQHNTQQKQSPSAGESSDLFSSLTEQEQQAILMTEPNFLRQQHLLHDNKMKVEMEQLDIHDVKGHTGTPPMRSNLSAMFDQPLTTTTDNHSVAPISLSVPSAHNIISATSPSDIFQSPYQPPTMSHPMGLEHQPYSTSASATTVKRTSLSNTKPRKEINRRSQQGIGSRGNNHRANPIPINAGSSNTSGAVTKHSSSVPTEIDHQRRFNELQARFRVNYARKSNTSGNTAGLSSYSSQQQHQHSSFSGGSNGFGKRTSRDFMTSTNNNGASVFGSSVPTSMEKRLVESVYGDTNNGENETSQSSNNMEASSTASVAIPKKKSSTNSNNLGNSTSSSISTSMKHASSFPSRTMPIQIQRVQRPNTNQPVDADQLQKRLDDQLIKANFDDITVSELKEMLRQRGKPATGKKAILLQRLVDERDNINAVRSGKASHRHSQPPPSLEATYPSPLLESPSSVPNSSMFLSSSPGSTTLSLNRSIANMHIGSPPMSSSQQQQQHIRRFSPYNNSNNNAPTGSSPRLISSPKIPLQKQAYSSSMPSNYLSSPPNNNNNDMMIPSSSFNSGFSTTTTTAPRNKRLYQGWNGRPRSYAPFASSALATPDRDNDKDPFDMMTKDMMDIQQYDGVYRTQQDHHGIKGEAMEWMNQSSTGNPSLNGILQDLPEGVSIDQFMVWLNENDQLNINIDPMKIDTTGMTPMDINQVNYSDGPIYDEFTPGDPDYTTT